VGYELVFPSSAHQAVLEMELAEQKQVAKSLRGELWCQESDSPLTVEVPDPTHSSKKYFAASLSAGYVAVFRCLTREELKRRRSTYQEGRLVFKLMPTALPPEPQKRPGLLRRAIGGH
jgi:hypothetical protein